MDYKSKRIEYLDMVRGFCIIYMILGHIGFRSIWFDHYIHAFHMPIFYFISGFLFKNCALHIFDYIRKMIKKIIVPYFLWAIIFLIIDNKTALGSFGGIKTGLYHIFAINNDGLPIAGALWFLTSFFFCNIIFYILRKTLKNNLVLGVISLTIMIVGICLSKYFNINLWWSLNSALVGIGIYYLGYIMKNKITMICNIKSKIVVILMLIIHFFLIKETGYVNMRTGTYPNTLMFIINPLLSFIVYANIATQMLKLKIFSIPNKLIITLGRESIVPLCLNQIIILCLNKLCVSLFSEIWLIHTIVGSTTILMLIALSNVISKTKLKILFGR